MKGFSTSIIFSCTLVLVSCGTLVSEKLTQTNETILEQDVTSDQTQHGFWKNPQEIYIATEWQTDDDDLGFWDVPELEKAFIDTMPKNRNDGLVVGELGLDGGDKDKIIKLAQEIADGQHDNIDSLLIAHKGKLVFESYYLWGRANLTHPQASVTKSYTGLALGRAMQMGYLTMADLDKPLVNFLKDLDSSKFVDGADRITLHQALLLRSGIRISDEQKEEFEKDPSQIQGQGLVQTILEQSAPITAESQSSSTHGNYSPNLVMQVIDAVVPGTAEEFIKNELLGKMGISTYRWLPGESGLPAAGWKSSLTSRDMAKIGTLAMNNGTWNGEQLIPEVFINKATSRIFYTGDDKVFGGGKNVSGQGYGYFWWNGDLNVGDKSYFSASAQGGGGQFIILVKELDLTVVVTSHVRHPTTLQMTAERILPAFIE